MPRHSDSLECSQWLQKRTGRSCRAATLNAKAVRAGPGHKQPLPWCHHGGGSGAVLHFCRVAGCLVCLTEMREILLNTFSCTSGKFCQDLSWSPWEWAGKESFPSFVICRCCFYYYLGLNDILHLFHAKQRYNSLWVNLWGWKAQMKLTEKHDVRHQENHSGRIWLSSFLCAFLLILTSWVLLFWNFWLYKSWMRQKITYLLPQIFKNPECFHFLKRSFKVLKSNNNLNPLYYTNFSVSWSEGNEKSRQ